MAIDITIMAVAAMMYMPTGSVEVLVVVCDGASETTKDVLAALGHSKLLSLRT